MSEISLAEENKAQPTINHVKASASRNFCWQKNEALHDARKKEPPAPPKEVNVSTLQGQIINRIFHTFLLRLI